MLRYFTFKLCSFGCYVGKKKIPKLIHRWLNPISIAYWFMDDGSLKWKNKSKAVRICTDNFNKKEVEQCVAILNNKFNLFTILYFF